MRRRLVLAAGAAGLLVIGFAIGTRLATGPETTRTVTFAIRESPAPPGRETTRRARQRSLAGAVEAATAYVRDLDGAAILDPDRLQRILSEVASAEALPQLRAAYTQAGASLRDRLGIGTSPEPVVIVRAVPVGYRVDEFATDAATVSVWRAGIVASGATLEPQQSWRTATVSLVWERGGWKIAGLRSVSGPTPPLTATPSSSADLFAEIPRFAEFDGPR
jgi:hypothetical protein